MKELQIKLEENLKPALEQKGYNIVSLDYFKSKNLNKRSRLNLIIENIGNKPITIKDCSIVSKEVAILIDVENLITEAYNLEVSSRGSEDHLVFFADYVKNIGKIIKIELKDSNNPLLASIIKVTGDKVILNTINEIENKKITLPISAIKCAILTKDTE